MLALSGVGGGQTVKNGATATTVRTNPVKDNRYGEQVENYLDETTVRRSDAQKLPSGVVENASIRLLTDPLRAFGWRGVRFGPVQPTTLRSQPGPQRQFLSIRTFSRAAMAERNQLGW